MQRPVVGEDGALGFMKLAAHDLRWSLLRELGRSDRSVSELIARVGQPGNLVSYHLGQLRADGLVRERHSSADARVVYYSLDLQRFQLMLLGVAAAIHPGLVTADGRAPARRAGQARSRVLFLCTHNSARSQMAEAALRAAAGNWVAVSSAGSEPTELHPLAVEVMARRGIDIRRQRSKHVDTLRGRRFDVVITLCDSVREVCPTFAASPELVHWSLADPSQEATEAQRRAAFDRVADEIVSRVRYLVLMLDERRT